jgi:predicted ATPase
MAISRDEMSAGGFVTNEAATGSRAAPTGARAYRSIRDSLVVVRAGSGDPGGLVGREHEIAEVASLAAARRLVTLCGAAGIGKTRLLRAVTASMEAAFPDGAVVVPLGDLRQPELVASRVAEYLGIYEEPNTPVTDTLAAALPGRRVLLALDGVDHVAGACARLCGLLLAAAPELVIIASGREQLGADGEAAWPVPPLGLPGPGTPSPQDAVRSDAVRLLAVRAATAGAGSGTPGFDLNAGNCAAVAGICRALGGVPLALELAAARLPAAGAAAAREAITARLGGPAAGSPEQALDAVLAWSHDLLDPGAQVLLRRLSVLSSWSLEMAEQVGAGDGLPARRVAGLLDELAGAALIVSEPARIGPARFRMPRAVAQLAAVRLDAAREADVVRRRLRDYVARLAYYAAAVGTLVPTGWPVPPQVSKGFEADAENFRAVLAWCLENGDAETGLRICTALRLCWQVRGVRTERAWWLDALGAAAGAEGVQPAVLGPALTVRAQLALDSMDLQRAGSCAAAALDLCRAAGDTRFSAAALDLLARVTARSGRAQEALEHSGEALNLTLSPEDRWTRAFAYGSHGIALSALGRLAEAVDVSREGLALWQELDNQWGVTLFQLGLGSLARISGDLGAAREHYQEAMPFVRAHMGAPEVARWTARLGRVELRLGDLAAARQRLAESLQLSVGCGSRLGIARALRGFAELARAEDQPGRALTLAAAVTALCETAHLPPLPAARVQRYRDEAARLGDEQVTELWAAGRQLTAQAAAALALQPPDLEPRDLLSLADVLHVSAF